MYIQPLRDASYKDIHQVGGKAASLGEMLQAGIRVPDGFVITTKAYKKYRQELPDAFSQELLEAFDTLGAERVAVRSSSVGEDSDDASWAGQLESVLNVTREKLVDAVKVCWESTDSARVRSYAKTHGASQQDLEVAVVVQKMVDSEVAGVAFSTNPITGNDQEVLVEAVHGLGELLVQGSVTPDTYMLSKSDGSLIEYSPNSQTEKLVYQDGQTKTVSQTPGQRTLTDQQLVALLQVVKKIEGYYGKPQDIEWAQSRGRLYIVQARPITT